MYSRSAMILPLSISVEHHFTEYLGFSKEKYGKDSKVLHM
jgi:hypothetical protein